MGKKGDAEQREENNVGRVRGSIAIERLGDGTIGAHGVTHSLPRIEKVMNVGDHVGRD